MKKFLPIIVVSALVAGSYYAGYGNGVRKGAAATGPMGDSAGRVSVVPGAETAKTAARGSPTSGQGAEEPRQLLAAAGDLPPSRKRTELLKAAYARWAATDPAAALKSARERAAGERHDMTAAVVAGWAGVDPAGAWKWIGDNPSKPRLDGTVEFYTEAIRGMVDTNKGEMSMALLEALPPGEPRGMLTRRFIALWGGEDPGKAVEWLQTQELKDPGAGAEGLSALSAVMGRRDVSEGLKWIDSLPPSMQRNAVGAMAREWLKIGELDAVVQWASTIPDRPEYDGVLNQLGSSLVTIQPQVAFTLLTAQHDAKTRDVTLEMGAGMLTRSAPEEAIKWALAMSTPQGVESNVTKVYNSWSKSNNAAARSFVESAALPDSLKKKLLQEAAASSPR